MQKEKGILIKFTTLFFFKAWILMHIMLSIGELH